MPKFIQWATEVVGIDVNLHSLPKKLMVADPSIINDDYLEEIGKNYSRISFDGKERMMHSHAHSLQEVWQLREGKFARFCDVVIYPETNDHVIKIVHAAHKYNVVIVPYGGGTNVTKALLLDPKEKRMIVSLDMTRMDKILEINHDNMTAHVQCGIIGSELEKQLEKQGFVCGHEPDSVEFSSLGGWISTNASGMKKNKYGNIEDIVINLTIVTPTRVYTYSKNNIDRVSLGPNIKNMMIGHEGNFGVITDCVLKLRKAPASRVYGSIVFPDFHHGVMFMKKVGHSGIWPASCRLLDNSQFKFGSAIKPDSESRIEEWKEAFGKWALVHLKKIDIDKLSVCTLVFEGTNIETKKEQDFVYMIAKQFKGIKAGESAGIRGYFLTFTIAYIRDFTLNYKFIAESFETSCPYDQIETLCDKVSKRIIDSCKSNGVRMKVWISSRVTQLYNSSATVYIYFGFNYHGVDDPVAVYEKVETDAREEILKCGGSLSHHHGVGKIRKNFLPSIIGSMGIEILQSLKKTMDPKNIMGCSNLIDFPENKE